VEVLRNELQRAEMELEDRCWIAPPVLQHWLQITYELETQVGMSLLQNGQKMYFFVTINT
jgi:stromal interaction molecule 1